MNRGQLEHVIRAAAANAEVRDIVVIGSQAILGTVANPPNELIESMEADVFPRDKPELSIVIDGAMGELSMFHGTFGYYAHGVDESTAMLPIGWKDRLVRVETPQTPGAVGWCLELHDLAIGKMAAMREKDFSFVVTMLRQKYISLATLRERLTSTPSMKAEVRDLIQGRLERWAGDSIKDSRPL